MKKLLCYVGIGVGALSLIFGLVVLGADTGLHAGIYTYGGDAYTGIQNAAAYSANNLVYIAEILRKGLGFLLIIIGLTTACKYGYKLGNDNDVKVSETLRDTMTNAAKAFKPEELNKTEPAAEPAPTAPEQEPAPTPAEEAPKEEAPAPAEEAKTEE